MACVVGGPQVNLNKMFNFSDLEKGAQRYQKFAEQNALIVGQIEDQLYNETGLEIDEVKMHALDLI